MPAILPEETWEKWLDPGKSNDLAGMKDQLMEYIEPLEWYPVSRMVNSANDGAEAYFTNLRSAIKKPSEEGL